MELEKQEVKKIKGKDLVKGTQYFLDQKGNDIAIFEGVIQPEEGIFAGDDRCLFTPVGKTKYLLYDDQMHQGKYVGQYTLGMEGNYFEIPN